MRAQTIVVGYDGSEHARLALEGAADLVTDDGRVHAVVAYHAQSPHETADRLAALPEEFRATYDPLAGPKALADEATKRLANHGVDHITHLVDGRASGAILDVADDVDADLIIVGSRGLGRAARFVRGSVSTSVANNASRSVLIIHDDKLDRDD